MISPFRMFTRATSRTTALVNRQWCAHCPTPSLECPTAYTNRRFHGIDLGRVLSVGWICCSFGQDHGCRRQSAASPRFVFSPGGRFGVAAALELKQRLFAF